MTRQEQYQKWAREQAHIILSVHKKKFEKYGGVCIRRLSDGMSAGWRQALHDYEPFECDAWELLIEIDPYGSGAEGILRRANSCDALECLYDCVVDVFQEEFKITVYDKYEWADLRED